MISRKYFNENNLRPIETLGIRNHKLCGGLSVNACGDFSQSKPMKPPTIDKKKVLWIKLKLMILTPWIFGIFPECLDLQKTWNKRGDINLLKCWMLVKATLKSRITTQNYTWYLADAFTCIENSPMNARNIDNDWSAWDWRFSDYSHW